MTRWETYLYRTLKYLIGAYPLFYLYHHNYFRKGLSGFAIVPALQRNALTAISNVLPVTAFTINISAFATASSLGPLTGGLVIDHAGLSGGAGAKRCLFV